MKKILTKITLTILSVLLLTIGTFNINENKNNYVNDIYAESIISNTLDSIVTGLATYMVYLGIKFSGDINDIKTYLSNKIQSYGLLTQMLTTGININLSTKRFEISNQLQTLFNNFISQYITENTNDDELSNVVVNSVTNLLFNGSIKVNGQTYSPNDFIFDCNNKTYSHITSNHETSAVTVRNGHEYYNKITDMVSYLPKYRSLSTSNWFNSNYKITYYFPNTDYYITWYNYYGGQQSGYDAVYYYTDLKVKDETSYKSYSIPSSSYPYFCLAYYENMLSPMSIGIRTDENNNTYYEFKISTSCQVALNEFNYVEDISQTDIFNTDYNNAKLLNSLITNEKINSLQIKGINENVDNIEQYLSDVDSKLTDITTIVSSTVVSAETGMTDEEAQNSNWFTIIKNALATPINWLIEQFNSLKQHLTEGWNSLVSSIKNIFEGDFDSEVETELDTAIENSNEAEGYFSNLFENSLEDIELTPLSSFGNKITSSMNWVRQQFENLTEDSPYGTMVTYSLSIGFILLLIGRGIF